MYELYTFTPQSKLRLDNCQAACFEHLSYTRMQYKLTHTKSGYCS